MQHYLQFGSGRGPFQTVKVEHKRDDRGKLIRFDGRWYRIQKHNGKPSVKIAGEWVHAQAWI